MGEQRMYEDEDARVEAGAPERDLASSEYVRWREDTDERVVLALDFYGTYLVGQTNGFSDALSLPAVHASFLIEGVTPDSRPDLARRLLIIHSCVMDEVRRREKMAKRHG